jgi:hypothetical protein
MTPDLHAPRTGLAGEARMPGTGLVHLEEITTYWLLCIKMRLTELTEQASIVTYNGTGERSIDTELLLVCRWHIVCNYQDPHTTGQAGREVGPHHSSQRGVLANCQVAGEQQGQLARSGAL